MAERENLPEPVKRSVRQRCGFGCVICGIPFIHYDHIKEYSEVKEHSIENITLLCAFHHDEKTRGRLPLEKLIAADADPVNVRNGTTKPLALHYGGANSPSIVIGTDTFTHNGPFIALGIDEQIVLGVEPDAEGNALFNAVFLDKRNLHALNIYQNEIIFSTSAWDITWVGQTITLKNGLRDIFLELMVNEAENRLTIARGHIYYNGVDITIGEHLLSVGDGEITFGYNNWQSPFGILIGRIPPGVRPMHPPISPVRYCQHPPPSPLVAAPDDVTEREAVGVAHDAAPGSAT